MNLPNRPTKIGGIMHSTLTNRLEQGEHDAYRPGEFDLRLGRTNPETRGYVRGFYSRTNHVAGPGGLLAQLQPFTSHSLRAFREPLLDGGFLYLVFSYGTEIASWYQPKWNPEDPGRDLPVVQVSTRYYSAKTREHQGMVLAWMGHSVDKWIAPTEFGD